MIGYNFWDDRTFECNDDYYCPIIDAYCTNESCDECVDLIAFEYFLKKESESNCIFNSVDESRSEDLQNKNAQIVVPDDACCDMCGIAETNLFYFPVGIMPMYICSNCAAIMLME